MVRKRGRKSAAELAAIAFNPPRTAPVPAGFDDQEVDTWHELTGSQPADHLRPEFLPLLEAMTRHVVAGRKISQMIGEIEASMAREEADEPCQKADKRVRVILGAAETLNRLYQMRDREVRASSSLATRLRITPAAIYDRTKPKGRPSGAPVPWENSPAYRRMHEQPSQAVDPLLGGAAFRRP